VPKSPARREPSLTEVLSRLRALEQRLGRLEAGRPPPGDGRTSGLPRGKERPRCPGCGLPLRTRDGRCAWCGRPV